jgi:outer membrane autotransporter protein
VLGSPTTPGTVTYNLGGVSAGLDYLVDPRVRVGLSVGYGSGNVWTNGFDGKGWSNSYNVSLYGSFASDNFYVDALAGYSNNQNQMKRQIVIPAFATFTAQGQSYANQFLGQIEGGYHIGVWQPAEAAVTPFVRLQGSTNTQMAFSETGAGLIGLNVVQQTTNSLRSTLGADLSGAIDFGWREKLAMRLRLGWQHEYADAARPVTAAFVGAPSIGFTVYGAESSRDSAVLGLAADTAVADGFRAYLRYDGDVSATANNHVLSAGIRMSW